MIRMILALLVGVAVIAAVAWAAISVTPAALAAGRRDVVLHARPDPPGRP